MGSKITSYPSPSSLFMLSIAGIAFSSMLILFMILRLPQNSIATISVTSIQSIAVSEQIPVRLKIPTINVNAAVESLGLTSTGAMDVPDGPDNVGWYNLGPKPGENGNSVIDGHSTGTNGAPAVFSNLNKLQAGDKIYVEGERGTITTFVVREIRIYAQTDNTSDVFVLGDGKAHLNIITCHGAWDEFLQTYAKRLVVFTDKEIE